MSSITAGSVTGSGIEHLHLAPPTNAPGAPGRSRPSSATVRHVSAIDRRQCGSGRIGIE